MANSTSSAASGMSILMSDGEIGTLPLEVSTPCVGSNAHPWVSQQGAPTGGNGRFWMMRKTPTRNSPLATRGGNMLGGRGQQQHQQDQQQGQGQQTMMGEWGGKNSVVNTAMGQSPVRSPNLGTAADNPNASNPKLTRTARLTPVPAETLVDSKLPLDEDQDDDDEEDGEEEEEEEDGEEEEEEEEEVTPPLPAKGKQGRKNATHAAAVAQPSPPPPAQTTIKGKKGKGKTVLAIVEKEKLVEKPAPPPPPPPPPPVPVKERKEPVGKKGGAKKGSQDEEHETNIPGGLGGSLGSLWDSGASASTPKPPVKGANPSNWGAPPPTTAGAGGGGTGTNGLRKQDGEDLVKPTGGKVVDEIPASVHESLWAKARASSATPTVAGAAGGRAAATPTPAAGKTGWKASENEPSRLGNTSVFDSFENEGKSFKTSTPAAAVRTKAASPTVGGGATKKKTGGGPAKKITIEEVSDEEDGVLDNSLPINYQGVLEPKSPDPMSGMTKIPDFVDLNAAATAASQSAANSFSSSSPAMSNAKSSAGFHVHQPKPNVPGMFNSLFDYGNGNTQQPRGGACQPKRNWNYEGGFFSSNPASMINTLGSTSPALPEDGVMQGMSGEFLKKAEAQWDAKAPSSSSAASAARGGGPGKTAMDAGFSTDWEGTAKANRRGGGGGGGSGWGKSLLSGVMSEDEMMGAGIPGGFSKPASAGGGGSDGLPSAMSIWEAGKQKQRPAKASGSGGPTSNASSGPGGEGTEADDLFARFVKSQRLEAMKGTGGSR
ncbi:hypothetical protein BKA70DRAFT_1539378 [Coprinopsis sp. MPI-PUGE-AT-0042]|nr:hypothetical protein BKA70DRAFT_1539378 [Coprinopsis sp. MPI-PUGE-AT-0042]